VAKIKGFTVCNKRLEALTIPYVLKATEINNWHNDATDTVHL